MPVTVMASMMQWTPSSTSGVAGSSGRPFCNSQRWSANSSSRSSVSGKSLLPLQLRPSATVSRSAQRFRASPSLICVAVDCRFSGLVTFDYRRTSGYSGGVVLHWSRANYREENAIRSRALRKDDFQNESFDSFPQLSDSGEVELNFFERLALAWSILFPPVKRKSSSTNADIAKQRLRMILISDRCSVNDEAKRRIVNNIVGALSDFVEIESEDKVQLTVSSDPSLGTVYSVTVPVRRVKPAYQEYSRELQNVALAEEFEEFDDEFRTLDIKLEYPDAFDLPQP